MLVGRVGIFLALQTNRHVLRILDAVLAAYAGSLEVASVDLHARLIGIHRETNLCSRRPEHSANLRVIALAVLVCVETPVVVVARSVANLLE